MAKHKRNDDGVIELPGDRDEVRDEIERQREVTHKRKKEQLPAARDSWIACQPTDEDDAVGDEGRKRPRVGVPATGDEPADETRVDHKDHAERNQEPAPPRQTPRLSA